MSAQTQTAQLSMAPAVGAAPAASDRDALFKTFGRAWFKRDVDLLFQAVTPDFEWRTNSGAGMVGVIRGREAVAAEFAAAAARGAKMRINDVVYHHAPDATFMTFSIVETNPATGAETTDVGVERYTFRDGRIAVKDVYRKRAAG